MTRSFYTHGPPDATILNNMAARRQRVQSAANKKSRQMANIIAQTTNQPDRMNSAGKPIGSNADQNVQQLKRRT